MDEDNRQDEPRHENAGDAMRGASGPQESPHHCDKSEPEPSAAPQRVDDAIRRSEQRLRAIFDNAGVGMLEVNSEDLFIAANSCACQILGYSLHDLLGMSVHELTAPEDRPRSDDLNAQLHDGRLSRFETEKRYLRSDGKAVWLHVTVSAIRDQDGQFTGGIATIQDTSDRKHAEEGLQRSRGMLRYVLDSVPQSIFWKDRDGVYMGCNHVFAEAVGLKDSSEIVGKTDFDLPWPMAEARAYRADDAYVIENKTRKLHILEPLQRADGSRLWVDTSKLPLLDEEGNVYGVLGVYEDITERKRAQDALRVSEEQLKHAARVAGLGIFDHDHVTDTLKWSLDLGRISGWEPGKETSLADWIALVHPEDRARIAEAIKLAHDPAGDGRYSVQHRIVRPDGSQRWVSAQSQTFFEGEGPARHAVRTIGATRDITDDKEAHDALRISEEQLKHAARVAGLGIFDHDHIANTVKWSLDLRRISGWGPDKEIGLADWVALIHPEDRARIVEAIKLAHDPAGDGRYSVQHRILRADGSQRWVSVQSQTFFEGKGPARHAVRTIGATLDVTDDKEAQDALRASETRYRGLVELSPDAIFVNRNDHIELVNPAAMQLFGAASAEQLLGRSPLDLFHPDCREIVRDRIGTVLSGQAVSLVEEKIIRLDGAVRVVELAASPFVDQHGTAIQVFLRDITDRKRAEEALRSSELQMGMAVDAADMGLWSYNAISGDVTTVRGHGPISGLPNEVSPSNVRTFAKLVHPDDWPMVSRAVQAAVEQGEEYRVEFRICLPGDGIRWVLALGHGLRDEQGKPIGLTGVDLDITDRKLAEEEIRRTAEDLRRSNQDLEQFAYVASHDLQEPLRMVIGYMDLLERTHKGQLDEDAEHFIGFAVEGAHRMQQLIDDLLTYSRITSRGKDPQRISMQTAFNRALADLRGVMAETGAQITHDPLPEVLGDETQLSQVLMNLFSNAIKFRGPQPCRVHVGAGLEGTHWVFSVRDNGIGIEPRSFDRIFQVFQRLHTRQEYPGSGIGLAICKRIVERHGGHIWVESQIGQGATFFFTLPAP